jgi:3'-phosphoadenosine 5'-phosphosulfate sulfotransferase (PAPS reductase)/FAD synthetase and related enzymes
LKQFKTSNPVVLKPKEDFITMMVEKGYTAPDFRFRWCMKRLKIEPVKEFMKKLGRYVQVSGVRASESPERSRKYGESEKVLRTPNPIVMPILDWSTGDVFEFLKKYKRWDGKDFGYLLELYNVKEGNGCGCPISSDVRFGCWTCTVVKVNKMPVDPILENARKRLMEVSNDPKFRILDENGRPRRKLNDRGRKEVAKVFLEVAEKYPEALGYDIDELKEKLRKIIEK